MSKPQKERVIEVPDQLIKKLLTDSELRMIQQRYVIINLLKNGLSIRKIAQEAKVGTDTVVRIIRMVERRDLKRLIDGFDQTKKDNKKIIPWVFGKGD